MDNVSKQQQITTLLSNLRSSLIDLLPDDDFFWENRRDDVEEVMGYINEISRVNAL